MSYKRVVDGRHWHIKGVCMTLDVTTRRYDWETRWTRNMASYCAIR